MAVEVNTERKAVELKWDPGDHQGDVVIFAEGSQGDMHNTRPMPNDGLAPVSYPADFVGSSEIEVRDMEGNVLDSGSVDVE